MFWKRRKQPPDPLGGLGSPDDETRGRAMQAILAAVRKDASRRDMARDVFLKAIAFDDDVWTCTSAARGMQFLDGVIDSLVYWQALLRRTDPVFVSRIMLAMDDPAHVPTLLAMLESSTERPVQAAAICMLGRSKNPVAFEPIVSRIHNPLLRSSVVGALSDLGDPRAIPFLRQVADDETPLDQSDERGAIIRVCDIAAQAIRAMERDQPPMS